MLKALIKFLETNPWPLESSAPLLQQHRKRCSLANGFEIKQGAIVKGETCVAGPVCAAQAFPFHLGI
jgi:hypothetical protein